MLRVAFQLGDWTKFYLFGVVKDLNRVFILHLFNNRSLIAGDLAKHGTFGLEYGTKNMLYV